MAEDALDTPLTEQEFYERLECACRSREVMYSLLSRLYRSEVDEELLAALRGHALPRRRAWRADRGGKLPDHEVSLQPVGRLGNGLGARLRTLLHRQRTGRLFGGLPL